MENIEQTPNKNKKYAKLKLAEVAAFCSQLHFFIRSGITVSDAIALMITDWNGRRFKRVLLSIEHSMKDRLTLSKAMEDCGAFPPYAVKMTGVGEISGNLEEVMNSLALFYQREQKTMERFKGFFMNSMMLIVMMAAVVLLLIIEVLPMFDDLLTSLGGEMPGVINSFMNFGVFVTSNYITITIVTALLIMALIIFFRTKPGIFVLSYLKIKLPLVRSMYEKLITARFVSALTLLVSGDVEQHTVLEMASDVINNNLITKKLAHCEEAAYRTGSVYEAIDKEVIFPDKVTKMLIFGEKAGNISSMAIKLSETYDNEVTKFLNKISTVVEVTFIVLLSMVVGVILVSVILPLINIMSFIG